jgi:hypothetical protein
MNTYHVSFDITSDTDPSKWLLEAIDNYLDEWAAPGELVSNFKCRQRFRQLEFDFT